MCMYMCASRKGKYTAVVWWLYGQNMTPLSTSEWWKIKVKSGLTWRRVSSLAPLVFQLVCPRQFYCCAALASRHPIHSSGDLLLRRPSSARATPPPFFSPPSSPSARSIKTHLPHSHSWNIIASADPVTSEDQMPWNDGQSHPVPLLNEWVNKPLNPHSQETSFSNQMEYKWGAIWFPRKIYLRIFPLGSSCLLIL